MSQAQGVLSLPTDSMNHNDKQANWPENMFEIELQETFLGNTRDHMDTFTCTFTCTFSLTWTFAGHQWASHQAKKSHDKTLEVFFHAAFDFDAPGLRNTDKKWENDRFLKKTSFF